MGPVLKPLQFLWNCRLGKNHIWLHIVSNCWGVSALCPMSSPCKPFSFKLINTFPFTPIFLGLQIMCMGSLMQTQLQIKYPPPHQQVCYFVSLAFGIKSRSSCEVIETNNKWKQMYVFRKLSTSHLTTSVHCKNGMHHTIHRCLQTMRPSPNIVFGVVVKWHQIIPSMFGLGFLV